MLVVYSCEEYSELRICEAVCTARPLSPTFPPYRAGQAVAFSLTWAAAGGTGCGGPHCSTGAGAWTRVLRGTVDPPALDPAGLWEASSSLEGNTCMV